MTAAATSLKGALLLDFTNSATGFRHCARFDTSVVELVREQPGRMLVVIDSDVSGQLDGPAVVRDHINLTGTSPLLGPNHPCGERFPIVQGIYMDDLLPSLPKVVAAGLRPGVKPDKHDLQALARFGAQAACCNLVPTMLIAAHAGSRMLAVLLPGGAKLSQPLLAEIERLTGGAA